MISPDTLADFLIPGSFDLLCSHSIEANLCSGDHLRVNYKFRFLFENNYARGIIKE